MPGGTPWSGGLEDFGGKFIGLERSFPIRLSKIVVGSGFLAVRWAESEIFENQGAAVVQSDLGLLPPGALVEAIGIGIGWIPRADEPVEVRFVVGNRVFFIRRKGAGGILRRGADPTRRPAHRDHG